MLGEGVIPAIIAHRETEIMFQSMEGTSRQSSVTCGLAIQVWGLGYSKLHFHIEV